MTVESIGLVLIPVTLFVFGAVVAGVRGAIRFAQYMVRSEEAQQRTADLLEEIAGRLGKAEMRLGDHDKQLAVIQWEIDRRNGRGNAGRTAIEPS
jgi:hypothetical protein